MGRPGLEEAITLSAELSSQYPDVPEFSAAHARYLDRQGFQMLRSGRPASAEKPLRRAMEIQTRLVKRYPRVPSYEFWLCLVERSLAECLLESGQWRESTRLLLDAVQRAERLDREKSLPGVGMLLGMAYGDLAQALWAGGEQRLALEMWSHPRPRPPMPWER